MKLNDGPFKSKKNETKKIEPRLNDEKRQLLEVDDFIEFTNRLTNETITAKIVALYRDTSFEQLYKKFDKISLGYKENEEANPEDMLQYYKKEEQEKYGVIGIEIKLLPDGM